MSLSDSRDAVGPIHQDLGKWVTGDVAPLTFDNLLILSLRQSSGSAHEDVNDNEYDDG